MRVRGTIDVIETDVKTGRRMSHSRVKNIVTTLGETMIADRLRGNTGVGGVSQYAIGGDATPAVAGDTGLLNELYRAVVTQTRASGNQLKITLHLGSTQGNGLTFREGGAFNEQGTMLCRGVFPDKAKTSSKELTIVHTLTFTSS